MHRFFLLAVALFLTAPVLAQTTTADPTQDPTALTNAFMKAMQDEDANTLSRLTSDDFMIVSFDGQTAEKDLLMQAVSGGFLVVDAAAPSGARARLYNNDSAVVTGNAKFKGSLQGQNFDTDVAFTTVCVKQGTGWKVANVQFSAAR